MEEKRDCKSGHDVSRDISRGGEYFFSGKSWLLPLPPLNSASHIIYLSRWCLSTANFSRREGKLASLLAWPSVDIPLPPVEKRTVALYPCHESWPTSKLADRLSFESTFQQLPPSTNTAEIYTEEEEFSFADPLLVSSSGWEMRIPPSVEEFGSVENARSWRALFRQRVDHFSRVKL